MTERLRQILVIIAALGMIFFNYLASTGYIGGITPDFISNKYPTSVTPAGYAFAIWGAIYLGVITFSLFQALPSQIKRFARIRSLFIASCLANCAWIYVWHQQFIGLSVIAIFALLLILALIAFRYRNEAISPVKLLFGMYFGWVTVASIANTAIALSALGVTASETTSAGIGATLLVVSGVIGVFLRINLRNIAYPLTIVWAVVAIVVKQRAEPAIVAAGILAVIILLVSTPFSKKTPGPK